jgi:crotonobetainyl-CoA:carnitine CoA-transferase CaiB-like acyl-CoA transferase
MLAHYGAHVIKIEPPCCGDIARGWGPPFYGSESAYSFNLNPNKQSVAIDLKQPQGRQLFLRLVERADVVLERLRMGTVDQLGIPWTCVKARNRRIVYCSISGFGPDATASGAVPLADITAGMYAAFAVVTALHARSVTGRGLFIDVSMLEGQLASCRT